eukprot:1658111-Karenia_brevis.AAC.1
MTPPFAAQMTPESLKPLPQQLTRARQGMQRWEAHLAMRIPVGKLNSPGRQQERLVAVVVEAFYNILPSTATSAMTSIAGTV